MEIGASYVRTPVYEMFLNDGNGEKTNNTILVNRAAIGFTASIGLAIPFKHFVVYGKYGWNIPFFVTEANLFTQGYTYKDIMKDMDNVTFEPKTDVGIKVKIPGTPLGIGVHYVMNKYVGKRIRSNGDSYSLISKGNTKYRVGGSVHDTYKYEVFGFSLYYLTKK